MYKNMSIEELSQKFVSNLVETNRGFNFYVDWSNIEDYKKFEIELNAMNVLIKCENIHDKFFELVHKIPTVIATFPLLFALAKAERKSVWKGKEELKVVNEEIREEDFYSYNFNIEEIKKGLDDETIEKYYTFFEKIGLKNLFENYLETSVLDYAIGVLVGLDSNGRKIGEEKHLNLRVNLLYLKYVIIMVLQ